MSRPSTPTAAKSSAPIGRRAEPIRSAHPPRTAVVDEAVLCERCRTPMFRMHAVWRCPQCGYKTDCCGW